MPWSRPRACWLSFALACQPSAPVAPSAPKPDGPAPGAAAPDSLASAPLPVAPSATPRVAAGSGAAASEATAAATTEGTSPAAATSGDEPCVTPPEPGLDRASPWTLQAIERVAQLLPLARRCTAALRPGREERATLRLVFNQAGQPLSQHVVHSTPGACVATECLKRTLAQVRSPKLSSDYDSVDVSLSLRRGSEPTGVLEPPDALVADESAALDPASCIDPEVARLSRAKVREVVNARSEGLQKCYAQALSRNHSAAGTVTFEFLIAQDGQSELARARDTTLDDCEAIRCMIGRFRGLSFPAPVGRSVRIIYPIRFAVEQPPAQLK
jgi:hypothetical protein